MVCAHAIPGIVMVDARQNKVSVMIFGWAILQWLQIVHLISFVYGWSTKCQVNSITAVPRSPYTFVDVQVAFGDMHGDYMCMMLQS